MLDIKKLRNEFEKMKELLSRRNKSYDLDKFLRMDKQRRQLITMLEELKSKQAVLSTRL